MRNYSAHFAAVQEIMEHALPQDIVIIVGDYNLPHLRWAFDADLNCFIPLNASSENEIALTEALFPIGLRQICSVPNDNGRFLDLVFSNDCDSVALFESPSPILNVDRHHKPLVMCIETFDAPVVEPVAGEIEFDFRRCDYNALALSFTEMNWSELETAPDVNLAVDKFYEKFYQILRQHVPLRRPGKILPLKHVWWNSDLHRLRNLVRKARKRYNKHRSFANKSSLRRLEFDFKGLQRVLYRRYIDDLQRNLKSDPASFWSHFRSKRRTGSIPMDVSFNGHTASTPVETADIFADYFQGVFNTTRGDFSEDYVNSLPSFNLHFPELTLSEQSVRDTLFDCDPHKGPGPDCIPPVLLKECAASLAYPVCMLFNRSLRERIFPNTWKLASITPVFKAGNARAVENYRPISILSSLSKCFEKIVHVNMYAAAEPIISQYQHGFVSKRSTVTNLMTYVSSLKRSLEGGYQVDAVYVDFSKAFDKVPHDLMIAKLSRLGFPSWSTDWLKSYLFKRQACVKMKNVQSSPFDTPSGVPQGSHLGPLLFILFVNDICPLLKCDKLLYADDLKIYKNIKSTLDCLALQMDIDTLLTWCNLNGMSVNSNKCKVINFSKSRNVTKHVYHLNDTSLGNVSSIIDLGINLDSKLNFSEHIAITTAKGLALLGFLRRSLADFDDVYALKTVYCAIVRSVMEYAVQVWAPYHEVQIQRLESVQRKFIRFALRTLHWNDPIRLPQYEQRCALIDLETLAKRRDNFQRIVVFDLLTGGIDSPFLLEQINIYAPTRQLRQRQFLWINPHRTAFGLSNPIDRCCRLFNEVYSVFDFNLSKQCFKLILKRMTIV